MSTIAAFLHDPLTWVALLIVGYYWLCWHLDHGGQQ